MSKGFRLSYAVSKPFSVRTTIILCTAYVLGFVGLAVWNFLTQAKASQCTSYSSATYDSQNCQPTPLEFAGTYYTRPVSNASSAGTVGLFPWSPYSFGNGSNTVPLDYSFLSLNWTEQPLTCVMYEQYLILHLDSGGSTVNSCYYCGGYLRTLCTSLDSERAQLPDTSATSYAQQILQQFSLLSVEAYQIATTAQSGAIVTAVRMNTHRAVAGVPDGVLPYNSSSFQISLGTTIGGIPISTNNSNSGIAQLASRATALSTLVEQATSQDLQPDSSDSTSVGSGQRTLQVAYICNQCVKKYKSTLNIISILLGSILAVLGPAFKLAMMAAEHFTTDSSQSQPPLPSHAPYSPPPMSSKPSSAGSAGGFGSPNPQTYYYQPYHASGTTP